MGSKALTLSDGRANRGGDAYFEVVKVRNTTEWYVGELITKDAVDIAIVKGVQVTLIGD